ncbi:MAG: SMEK domain-containing protein [Proteobacteria bacterium]|nr:SMEK domain-containing protein [Pseudomonadota bacterium]MBU4296775.1 SMEK domain-containing protein [Pseudomonadota bacterium]MCG2747192.1 SMEK domain-containing protein [Desulfobulbaceae bacterium]
MSRPHHIDFITRKLSALYTEINLCGKLNFLDRHLHAETFYAYFFNELFGWQLQNMNIIKPNAEAIDLIDHKNKIIAQVSATATKQKVESSLTKDLSSYSGYTFKFISISKDAGALRGKSFANPHNLAFDPQNDIHDPASTLRHISGLHIDDLIRIATLIKKELVTEVDPVRLESNLAAIINILAKEDWNHNDPTVETIPFAIDHKIDHNKLDAARDIIDDYSAHHNRVARIYADYDREGNNKSLSVLAAIKRYYVTHRARLSDDDLFFRIIECVTASVQEGANFAPIPAEELELCVNILVVDAFIRCKIFKNPVGYGHATS